MNLDLLKKLHWLIEARATGSPGEVSRMLGVSDRTVRLYIEKMRAMGADIEYCRRQRTYYYSKPVVLKLGYEAITPPPHFVNIKPKRLLQEK